MFAIIVIKAEIMHLSNYFINENCDQLWNPTKFSCVLAKNLTSEVIVGTTNVINCVPRTDRSAKDRSPIRIRTEQCKKRKKNIYMHVYI